MAHEQSEHVQRVDIHIKPLTLITLQCDSDVCSWHLAQLHMHPQSTLCHVHGIYRIVTLAAQLLRWFSRILSALFLEGMGVPSAIPARPV